MKCEHKCSKCIYFFKANAPVEKMLFNALAGQYMMMPLLEEVSGCGYSETAVLLDPDQPACHNFKDKEDERYITIPQLQEQFEDMFDGELEKNEEGVYIDQEIQERWNYYFLSGSNNQIVIKE